MKNGSFRGKPSKRHVIWVNETRDGNTMKRLDHEHFEKWTHHYGFEFETEKRVDHDRGEEPRTQYQCVFSWERMDGESIELGEEEWSFGEQKTPRTFVEIDEKGLVRVRGWSFETILNVVEMQHDGPVLKIKAADGATERFDARKLSQKPENRS